MASDALLGVCELYSLFAIFCNAASCVDGQLLDFLGAFLISGLGRNSSMR